MLNAGVYPEYKIEDIQAIVNILYEKDQQDMANRICNLYAINGYNFLDELFKKYNVKKSDSNVDNAQDNIPSINYS